MVEQRLGYLIKRTQQELRLTMDSRLEQIALTTPQYAALSILEQESGLSNADLARKCFLTPQTMHQIVKGLEGKGLIKRKADPAHGRKIEIWLTANGGQKLSDAHKIVKEIESVMTGQLTSRECKQTIGCLKQCIEALEEVQV